MLFKDVKLFFAERLLPHSPLPCHKDSGIFDKEKIPPPASPERAGSRWRAGLDPPLQRGRKQGVPSFVKRGVRGDLKQLKNHY